MVDWGKGKIREHYALAMQIDRRTAHVCSDSGTWFPETQDSDVTLGNWRQSNEDDSETGIKSEWDEYFKAARAKYHKGFSVPH